MTSKVAFYFLIAILVATGVTLSVMRHQDYGVPWTPGETRQVWDIEARVEFLASDGPVKVSLAAPHTQNGFTLVDESASSPGYGLSYIKTDTGRRAEWSIRHANGPQTIYYKTQFLVDPQAHVSTIPPVAKDFVEPTLTGPQQAAATSILNQASQRSSDNTTLTREIIKQFNDPDNQNASLLLDDMNKVDAISKLLATSKIYNKTVGVVEMEDGRRRQSIIPMIEVWDGNAWQLFNSDTNEQGVSDNMLIWDESNVSLLDVIGGKHSKVYFSMLSHDVSPTNATKQKIVADNLLNFSIHSLPLEEQSMFKTIMLIPIGAFIVVFLRVLIGLKTSGTFMPVLIAVAFVQTQLLPGIVGFLLIVGTGLIIRGYLSKLNLLLVSRISAVIITVILIISVFTIVAFNIGLTQGLTITFFPMIILSWTIERMSILWEEEGAKEVVMQGGGSLLTAVIIYLAMTNPYVQHYTFNFIGTQFIILACILSLGNYTGYRLLELRRFKPLAED
ncbi:inactive transglutaminase family protein [Vibrio sp. S11_S32]|uniref:inactive transglutaminase family protein n=1 Tax=Vibrio sp. S11_S32 TaxID=2720225 RepID=UPI001680730A|nr:inactive transglutaminase family protein [Vibrio sp. S11_S32]MBD1575409.1 inactive transglutaminase family protein [Vibrio sp. S11_S32]